MKTKCIVCGREFEKRNKVCCGGRGSRVPFKRRANSLTCSRICSKEWTKQKGKEYIINRRMQK